MHIQKDGLGREGVEEEEEGEEEAHERKVLEG
jgi:hypothetical protein